jgi:urease accessory protein
MCSSPGILDGDTYQLLIEVGKNSFLQLHTQSYQRIFNMKKGAQQQLHLTIEADATLIFLPHPTVPHHSSTFKSYSKIQLEKSSTLIWGEILTCGRKENDEIFSFNSYHNTIDIYMDERLIIRENLLMKPSLINPSYIGQLEGYTHQASLICLKPTTQLSQLVDAIYEALLNEVDISFGVSTTHHQGIIVRILGYTAQQLHKVLKKVTTLIQTQVI